MIQEIQDATQMRCVRHAVKYYFFYRLTHKYTEMFVKSCILMIDLA